MASTEKYEPSGLNKYDEGDREKMADRNADNEILNQLHKEAARKPKVNPERSAEGNVGLLDAYGNLKDSEFPGDFLALPMYLYSGKELPFTWEELHNKIALADFSGIRIGDFKTIELTTGEKVICEVAGIDTYLNYADVVVGHHIDFISRDCLATTYTYNATATNSGGYVGSALKSTLNGAVFNTLPADLKQYIFNKRALVEAKTAADATSWSWQDLGNLWLPSEREVWGQCIWGEKWWDGGRAVQYPIFKDSLRHIVKGLGNGGNRATWWLSSSRASSASPFCYVGSGGHPYSHTATAALGVPVCFRIS